MIKQFKLNDQEHPFRYSMNAWIKLGEFLGEDDVLKYVQSKPEELQKLKNLRFVVWAGIYGGYDMRSEPCPVSIDDVGRHLKLSKELILFVVNSLFEGVTELTGDEGKKPEAVN